MGKASVRETYVMRENCFQKILIGCLQFVAQNMGKTYVRETYLMRENWFWKISIVCLQFVAQNMGKTSVRETYLMREKWLWKILIGCLQFVACKIMGKIANMLSNVHNNQIKLLPRKEQRMFNAEIIFSKPLFGPNHIYEQLMRPQKNQIKLNWIFLSSENLQKRKPENVAVQC